MNLATAEYPCVADIIIAMKLYSQTLAKEDQLDDLDELVYDTISVWDEVFEDDEDWFNEDDTDIKDSLRDQVLEVIDQ